MMISDDEFIDNEVLLDAKHATARNARNFVMF